MTDLRIACRNNSGDLLVVFTVGGFELYVVARIGLLVKRSRLKMDQNERRSMAFSEMSWISSRDHPSSAS